MSSSKEQPAASQKCEECQAVRHLSRRVVLKSVLSISLGLHAISRNVYAAEDPQRARPQTGDVFVFSAENRQGQILTPQDVPMGGPPVIVYPMDVSTQTVRNGSRLNRILLVRFAPEELTEQTRAVAAEGIVAYSAVCTHTGCDVFGWENNVKHFVCPCHASTFDPKDRARVVSGPAPRPLAVLPLQIVDGKLVVAGVFSGRVGAEQK
jgi:rieske iron-sulfur protein